MKFKTEEEYKKYLEETIPDGVYQIGVPGKVVVVTGRGGKIEYELAIWRELQKWNINNKEMGNNNTQSTTTEAVVETPAALTETTTLTPDIEKEIVKDEEYVKAFNRANDLFGHMPADNLTTQQLNKMCDEEALRIEMSKNNFTDIPPTTIPEEDQKIFEQPIRRGGATTRLADNLIQALFETGEITVQDTESEFYRNNALFERILNRLRTEHLGLKLDADKRNLTIKLVK